MPARSAGTWTIITVSDRAPGTSFGSPTSSVGVAPTRVSEPTTRKFWSPAWAAGSMIEFDVGSRAAIWRTAVSNHEVAPQASPLTSTTRTDIAVARSRAVTRQVQRRRSERHPVRQRSRTPENAADVAADVAAHSRSAPPEADTTTLRAAGRPGGTTGTASRRGSSGDSRAGWGSRSVGSRSPASSGRFRGGRRGRGRERGRRDARHGGRGRRWCGRGRRWCGWRRRLRRAERGPGRTAGRAGLAAGGRGDEVAHRLGGGRRAPGAQALAQGTPAGQRHHRRDDRTAA